MKRVPQSRILQTLSQYWGYDTFRPFQEKTIQSILDGRDTFTILPTGGGKSVCFQLPALLLDGMAVVISPLISLMKDQVDYLKDMGIQAECLNSSLDGEAQHEVARKITSGGVKLLYLSPERLVLDSLQKLLKSAKLSFFVIDEAHCISHWGHNFREEYRQLGAIKQNFGNIPVHAFTATATHPVQEDIVEQLHLEKPLISVASVDRPNLSYRILPRSANVVRQIADIIGKRPGDPAIIYCLKRADVDSISEKLNALGHKNLPYHAGLPDHERKKNQDEFASENISLIVATIAFGMGVDRSNIRTVIHAAMPKSIEHYQQETGRAGRDGLPADCVLFYSGADYRTWEFMLRDSQDKDVLLEKLGAMYNFCVRPQCRHGYLVRYFSQEYGQKGCAACDFCLGEVDMVEDPLVMGQKVLSCVARTRESFGADYVADVLKGNLTENVQRRGHDKLSTFGLLSSESKIFIRFMIEQLIGQGFLRREGEYMTLAITSSGRSLLKGEGAPLLAKPIVPEKKKDSESRRRKIREAEWEGVDEELFDLLRAKRAELARQKGVPAYIVFGDKTLKDLALRKPVTLDEFAGIFGVGASKQKEYGETFIACIKEYVQKNAASPT
ncbi:MAG TPA: DNA helicase RecQ [Verrucomicrobiae bacterium]|nr:DNA helicase RecQ [Verrucomicrobiae bacterium]